MSHKAHCLLTQSLNKYLKTTKECKHVVTIKPFQMISEKLDPSHPHYKCLWNCYHLSVHHSIAIILNVKTKHKFCFQIDKKHSALNKWILYAPASMNTVFHGKQGSHKAQKLAKHRKLLLCKNRWPRWSRVGWLFAVWAQFYGSAYRKHKIDAYESREFCASGKHISRVSGKFLLLCVLTQHY